MRAFKSTGTQIAMAVYFIHVVKPLTLIWMHSALKGWFTQMKEIFTLPLPVSGLYVSCGKEYFEKA